MTQHDSDITRSSEVPPADDKQLAQTGLSTDLLSQIIDAVRQDAKPQRIILFGSRARGEWNDRSDIDIAVIPEIGSSFFSTPIEERIRTLLKIDILDFRKLNEDFQQEVLQNGVVIYEAA